MIICHILNSLSSLLHFYSCTLSKSLFRGLPGQSLRGLSCARRFRPCTRAAQQVEQLREPSVGSPSGTASGRAHGLPFLRTQSQFFRLEQVDNVELLLKYIRPRFVRSVHIAWRRALVTCGNSQHSGRCRYLELRLSKSLVYFSLHTTHFSSAQSRGELKPRTFFITCSK